jgi:hypothetical protein
MTGHITGKVGIEAGDIAPEYGIDWLRFIRFATTISSLVCMIGSGGEANDSCVCTEK